MRRERVSERIRRLSPAKRQLLGRLLEERSYDPSFLERPTVTPQSPLEALLAEVWEEVLGLETVGVEDNFFDLGGDSILSIRIVAKARKRSVTLTSRQLFENPTIAQLALQLGSTWQRKDGARLEAGGRQAENSFAGREHLRRNGSSLSPADFPEAELSPEDLAMVLSRVAARAGLEMFEAPQTSVPRVAVAL